MRDALEAARLALSGSWGWITIAPSLQLIVGIVAMTAGGLRAKHHARAVNAHLGLLALMTVGTFVLGWWLQRVFVNGPGISGGFGDASSAWPWSPELAPGLRPGTMGAPSAEWLRDFLSSWLVASLVAGAMMERVRATALYSLCLFAGLVSYPIASAWMGSPEGWLVKLTGFHDAFGQGTIYVVAGGFALGVLQVLGPRKASEAPGGALSAPPLPIPWLAALGALWFLFGAIALAASTLSPMLGSAGEAVPSLTMVGVYGTPAPLFGMLDNFLMAIAGGLLVGHVEGRGQMTTTLAGGMAGAVGAAPGADLYHPLQAFLLGAVIGWVGLTFRRRMGERYRIDDALGTVSVFGISGVSGLLAAGVLLWTYRSTSASMAAIINPFGNAVGTAFAFWIFGQLPGYVGARFLSYQGMLHVPVAVEIAGSDLILELDAAQRRKLSVDRERAAAFQAFDPEQ